MSYDSVQDKIFVVSNTAQQIVFGGSSDTSNFLDVAGLTFAPSYAIGIGTIGTDAVVKVDGVQYRRANSVMDDILTGVTITANSVGVTTIEIDNDTEKAVNALASFIKAYNTLLKDLRPDSISTDDRDNKMAALTEEDKEGMSDKEIEDYEKEYDELHTRDMILKSRELRELAKQLRSNTMGILINTESTFKSLRELGIYVYGEGNYEVSQYGYLLTDSVDLDVIKGLITENTTIMNSLTKKSDDVYLFFAQTKDESYTNSNGEVQTRNLYTGWAKNYETLISNLQSNDGLVGIKTRTDSAINKLIDRLNKDLSAKQRSAEDYLERLWKQFSAMETRVAAINSQSQYIAQLGNNTNSSSSS
jgi:flagellar hook-associated protein 2